MSDSDGARSWTLDRAQAAVRAAFLSKELVRGGAPTLHFTEIRRLISSNERSIGDRTLARALHGMLVAGQLSKNGKGKGTVYSIRMGRSEKVSASAHADAAWIERAAAIGSVGAATEGRVAYGVPSVLGRRVARAVALEIAGHQERIRGIVDSMWKLSEDALLKPVRGRVPTRKWRLGKLAVERMNRVVIEGCRGEGISARLWQWSFAVPSSPS